MEPLTWSVAAGLLLKYGPEIVDFIVRRVNAKGVVTLEEWQELYALAAKTPQSQLDDALTRAGVPLDDPKAVTLRELLGKRS